MKLVPVPFGNQTGSKLILKTYHSGLTVGQEYQILDHRMDEDSFSNTHYYLVTADSGKTEWVHFALFGY